MGIPTVLDRLIQQAPHQVLMPIFDPDFSGSSYLNTALGHRALLASLKDPDLVLAEPFEPPVENGHAKAGFGAFSFSQTNTAFVARFNLELAKFLGSDEHRAMLAKYVFGPDEIAPAITAKSEALCK